MNVKRYPVTLIKLLGLEAFYLDDLMEIISKTYLDKLEYTKEEQNEILFTLRPMQILAIAKHKNLGLLVTRTREQRISAGIEGMNLEEIINFICKNMSKRTPLLQDEVRKSCLTRRPTELLQWALGYASSLEESDFK